MQILPKTNIDQGSKIFFFRFNKIIEIRVHRMINLKRYKTTKNTVNHSDVDM